jgi:hypothetical protein
VLAVPVAIAMAGFGLLFGSTEVSAPLVVGPRPSCPGRDGRGSGECCSGVLWLSWRSRAARVQALRRGVGRGSRASGRRRRGERARLRRLGLGVGMVAVAAAVAVSVPAVAVPTQRDVLREATGPRQEISRAVSPLSAYRTLFADARVDEELFRSPATLFPTGCDWPSWTITTARSSAPTRPASRSCGSRRRVLGAGLPSTPR